MLSRKGFILFLEENLGKFNFLRYFYVMKIFILILSY